MDGVKMCFLPVVNLTKAVKPVANEFKSYDSHTRGDLDTFSVSRFTKMNYKVLVAASSVLGNLHLCHKIYDK